MTERVPQNEAEFWNRWEEAEANQRFEYELNRELILVLVFFVTALVGMGGFLGLVLEAQWLGWAMIGVLLAVLVFGAAFLLFVWHTYARRSAVLVQDDALTWLYVGTVTSLPWAMMDRELVAAALSGSKETRGVMGFQVGDEKKELLAYNPHMRVKNFPALMLVILQRLQNDEKGDGDQGEEGAE